MPGKTKLLWKIFLIAYFPFSVSLAENLPEDGNASTTDESINSLLLEWGNNQKITKTPLGPYISICDKLKGLSSGQLKHCHLYEDHMTFVNESMKNSINECQWQFKHHRWNCTSNLERQSFFGPVLKFGNKEAAFLQAITTAGVMHSIARSCRDGQLVSCSCSIIARPNDLSKEWIWRGCGDNLEYGYKFARNFMDIREKEKMDRKRNTEREYGRSLMNLHNYEAGRRAVLKTTRISCKCHGVSGSCSLITCWHQLPSFREIGDYIKTKYEEAIRVKVNRKKRLQVKNSDSRKPIVTDLVYIHPSPSYCERNETFGILGTENRECNKTSQAPGSCNSLCCDRNYNTRKIVVKEKCNCTFHWCCYVQCDSCIRIKEMHTCN